MILHSSPIPRSIHKRPLVMQSAMHLVDPAYPKPHGTEEEGQDPGKKQPEIRNSDAVIDWQTPSHRLGGAGRRKPQGGAKADTFSHYSWMSGETAEERNMLFHMIHVRMCILHFYATDVNNRIQHAL
jgi:hypothetical protein